VPDAHQLDDLRRRVREDPASLAFAQLAEEYRRAGALDEAIRTCRSGLHHHPEYLSARVTLGRALCARGSLDDAAAELRRVLAAAPENLAALRALTEVLQRHGDYDGALRLCDEAHVLAPGDTELQALTAALAASRPSTGPDTVQTSRTLALERLDAWLRVIRARQDATRRASGEGA
jgi:tetratricopeptide (TPR) repeat protein